MNNQSPFQAPGSLQEQKNQARTRVKVAVFFALTVNGIVLLGLLMQGCRKDDGTQQAGQTPTPPTFVDNTNLPPVTNDLTTTPPPTGHVASVENPLPPVPPPGGTTTVTTTPPPPPPPGNEQEYTVVTGDSFYSIGKHFGVSMKAIGAANPGVDSTKLKPGQKLKIPAATAAATTSPAPGAAAAVDTSDGSQAYSVKSGDNLEKIAKQHGTTVKALRTANNLKTDRITVGQKLKIPAKAASSTTTVATPPPPASDPGAAGSVAPAGSTATPH